MPTAAPEANARLDGLDGLRGIAALPYEHIALGNHREDFLGGFARVGFAYCLGIALYRSRLVLPGIVWIAYGLLALMLVGNPGELVAGFVVVGLVSPLVVLAGAKPHANQLMRRVGAISFPLYAVHYPILEASHHYGLSSLFAAASAILVAIAVARFADRPQRWHMPWRRKSAVA